MRPWDDGGSERDALVTRLHGLLQHGADELTMTTSARLLLDVAATRSPKVGGPTHLAIVDRDGPRWTPTRRVHWDGTALVLVSANLTINDGGIMLAPETGSTLVFDTTRSYRFDVANGGLGVFAREYDVAREIILNAAVTSATGDLNTAAASLRAQFGGGAAGFVRVEATEAGAHFVQIGNDANTAGVNVRGLPNFFGGTSVSAGAAAGYLHIQINGTNYRLPYFEP